MRLSIDIPDELHRHLKSKAAAQGRTISAVVRQMLEGYARGVDAPSGNATPARADASIRHGGMSGPVHLSKEAQAKGKTRKG